MLYILAFSTIKNIWKIAHMREFLNENMQTNAFFRVIKNACFVIYLVKDTIILSIS